jgi:hypothetical protein
MPADEATILIFSRVYIYQKREEKKALSLTLLSA